MVFDKKAYMKAYREKNKEKILEQRRASGRDKKYYYSHQEQIKQKEKEYHHSEHGFKNHKINRWINHGIKLKDNEEWESVFYYVESCDNCELCDKQFIDTKDRHLDHDHITGYIRDVLCFKCNINRGK